MYASLVEHVKMTARLGNQRDGRPQGHHTCSPTVAVITLPRGSGTAPTDQPDGLAAGDGRGEWIKTAVECILS